MSEGMKDMPNGNGHLCIMENTSGFGFGSRSNNVSESFTFNKNGTVNGGMVRGRWKRTGQSKIAGNATFCVVLHSGVAINM